MATPFIAEIRIFPYNFAPRNWAFCNGQLLSIAQNTALFSLLGTNYGGNGITTFALPNFQGSGPVHAGQGPGLSNYAVGEQGGAPTVTLLTTQIPQHSHAANAVSGPGNQQTPVGNVWAGATQKPYATTSNAQMNPGALQVSGGSQPHNNLPPYLVLNFCIALFGIFPSRN
jgi:microcystin-dependent protein